MWWNIAYARKPICVKQEHFLKEFQPVRNIKASVTSDIVCSKAEVLLLLIHCLL